MKKKWFRVASTILSLAILAGIATACGGGSSDGTTKGSKDNETTKDDGGGSPTGPKDPTTYEDTMDVTITIMTGFTQSDSDIQKMLEEKYNLNIELNVLPGWADAPASINLFMQSDDIPDVMWWWGMDNDFVKWKDADLLVDVSPYMNTYTNIRDYYNSMDPMTLFYATEEDGAIYRIPGDVAEPSCEVLWIRQDWLDNLNLTAPTTIAELEEVLRAFTEDDPDGNGVDDTYGLGGDGYDFRSFWPWIQGYNQTHYDRWVIYDDGSIGYGPAQENTREWVEQVARLYQAGYITPNITQDTDRDEEMANGGFGVTYSWVAWNNPDTQTMISFYNSNPDAEWVPIEMVTGANGNPQEDPATSSAWCFFGISRDAEDPERLFAFYDDMSSLENYIDRRYGTKGEHYNIDENGMYVPIIAPESDANNEQNIGLNLFHNLFNRKDSGNMSNTPATTALFEKVSAQSRDVAAQLVEWRNPADLKLFTPIKTDIEDEKNRFLWSVIGGQESIDNWDTYIATLNGLGLEDATVEAQQVYDAQAALVESYMTNKTNQK